jgi:DNA uptake protein ComE-like DNA-binding protein
MKKIKSHYWHNKRQRNGILFLALCIITLQIIYFVVDFSTDDTINLETSELLAFQSKIDSLKIIEIERRKPKIYPFNPSFLTDYKAYKLGLTTKEIDRLLAFRKTGKYINSAKQFQQVTRINDSLFNSIKIYFKFPDWLKKQKTKSYKTKPQIILSKNLNLVNATDLQKINGIGKVLSKRIIKYRNRLGGFVNNEQLNNVYGLKPDVIRKILVYYTVKDQPEDSQINTTIIDLNKASIEDFKSINGIGDKLSKRIIKYRNSINGFQFEEQLYEVYGLKSDIANRILIRFKVLTKPKIKLLNINEATFKEVLHLPYIDYELTKKIINYRDEFAEIEKLEDLKKIDGFPLDKYDRIALYLTVE